MHGHGRSDSAIVAAKSVNIAGTPAAERMEPRAETTGNANQQSTCRAHDRASVYQALDRIQQAARTRKKRKVHFASALRRRRTASASLFRSQAKAAPGVDGMTWGKYDADLEGNLTSLHRIYRGAYRALPWRRRYIPKPDGRQTPLAITVGQVRPECACGVECCLRRGFSRLLVWLPAQAQPARCVGCPDGRNRRHQNCLRMAERLCLSCSSDGVVLPLKVLEHRSRRGVRTSAVKHRVWRILNSELDLLSGRVSSQKGYQHKGCIQPGRHAGSANDIAICNYPCVREDRAITRQQVSRSPVCRHPSSRENTSRPT